MKHLHGYEMHNLNILALFLSASTLAQGRVTSRQLPIVDLTYAVHQATLNVRYMIFGPFGPSY